jgi:glycosyltransferase involved in cell wall biosynthesis
MEDYGIEMSKNISQTVIIPTRNEEDYIEACINSLIDDWVISTTEFLIVDGKSKDRTIEIVKKNFAHLNLKILENPNLYQSYAMNIGIKNSSSKDTHPWFSNEGVQPEDWCAIMIRADAHCIFPPNYIRNLRQTIRDNIGVEGAGVLNMGSIQNAVGTDTFTKAVATVMNSKYAMGGVKYRQKQFNHEDKLIDSDTAYLGGWMKGYLEGNIDLFISPDDEYLVYNQEFQINEDYELNIRINKSYHPGVVVNTELVVNYFVRNSLSGIIKQFFRYGLWKTKTLSIHPDSLKKRQLAPVAFVLFLATLVIGNLILPYPYIPILNWVSSAIGFCWLILILRIWKDSPKITNILLIPVIVLSMHISWGLGFLYGLLRWARGGWNKL